MKKIIVLALSFFLFFLWFFYVEPGKLFAALQQGKGGLAWLASLLGFSGLFFKALRLHLVLKNINNTPLRKSIPLFYAGFALDYFFSLLGIVSQVGLYHLVAKISFPAIFGFMVFLRILDYLVIFPFLFVLILKPPFLFSSLQQGVGLGLLFLLFLLFFLLLGRFLFWQVFPKRTKIGFALEKFYAVFFQLLRFPLFLSLSFLTFFEYVVEALGIMLLLRAFHVPAGFGLTFFSHLFIQFFYLIPNVPAEIGTHEWLVQLVFHKLFGFDRGQVAAANIFSHFMNACFLALAGFLSFSFLPFSLKDFFSQARSRQSDEQESPARDREKYGIQEKQGESIHEQE